METPDDPHWADFIKNYKTRIEKAFSEKGISGVHSFILESLDTWKEVPLNIAVTGNSGVGKSSFINTLREVYADDEDGAEVDVLQCTDEPTPYKHKDHENLVIWDLPGVGTPEFPKETYLDQVKFQRYDYFIIVSAFRFTENDLWLAKAIKDLNDHGPEGEGKLLYFVRTKVDVDIASTRKSHRQQESETSICDRIKQDLEQRLQKRGVSNVSVFLIENYERDKFDFNLLATKIVNESRDDKRDAMAMSLSVLTEGIIDAKQEAFLRRMKLVCCASAAGGAVPLPGLSVALDMALLLNEAKQYREQFQLDEEGLKKTAKLLKLSDKEIKNTLDLESTAVVLTIRGLMSFFSILAVSEGVETLAKYTIPVLGSIISGNVSYYSTKHCLNELLNSMVSDAKKINREITRRLEADKSQVKTEEK